MCVYIYIYFVGGAPSFRAAPRPAPSSSTVNNVIITDAATTTIIIIIEIMIVIINATTTATLRVSNNDNNDNTNNDNNNDYYDNNNDNNDTYDSTNDNNDKLSFAWPASGRNWFLRGGVDVSRESNYLHSAKGGAVETGCSDLYGVVYYFTI